MIKICVNDLIDILNDGLFFAEELPLSAHDLPVDELFDFFSMFAVNQLNLKDKQMDKANKQYIDNS